jgi:hypothetical protein
VGITGSKTTNPVASSMIFQSGFPLYPTIVKQAASLPFGREIECVEGSKVVDDCSQTVR